MRFAGALALLLISGAHVKSQSKVVPPSTQTPAAIACPDRVFTDACRSYAELVNAADPGVMTTTGFEKYSVNMVCFRPQDSFFIVEILGPAPSQLQAFEKPSDSGVTTARGIGQIRGFEKGVRSILRTPITIFSGEWSKAGVFGPFFRARQMGAGQATDDQHSLFVDESQLQAVFRYQNQANEDIDYSLVVQRSTGRFTETYTEVAKRVPLVEAGRCLRLVPKGQ